jgi:phosphoglycolate phosphatase
MNYPVIVFDWDGTLVDSASAIVECIQQASCELGLEVPERERASHVIGLGLRDSLRFALPALSEKRYAEFAACYSRHFLARESAMLPFAGIRDVLEELRARGHTLAVATGKSRPGLDRALEASGLKSCFAATRCADETHPKPNPAMLLALMQALRISGAEALMIGDTSHDMDMARSAGVEALAVSYGAHPGEALRACAPRGCVDSVEDLRQWLRENA